MLSIRMIRTTLLLGLILGISALVGCSGFGKGTSSLSESPLPGGADSHVKDAGSSEIKGLKPYNLVFYYPASVQKDQAAVVQAINGYLTKKINATVELNPIDWGQWSDKSNLLIAAREPVDIYFTANWSSFASNVSKGAFLNLDPLLPEFGKGILQTLNPLFLDGSEIDGKHYALPANKELASQGGIIFRQDVADELGITARLMKVETIADLEPLLKIVKEKTNLTPLYLTQGENFNAHYFANYDYMGDANIPGVILKDGTSTKVVSRFDLPRYRQTLDITRKFMLDGLINKDAATSTIATTDAMANGNVFAITASLKPGKDKEMELAANMIGKLQQLPMTERTISTDETTGAMLAISTTSGDPARAMMFINKLYTDQYLINLLNFGIEGVHYDKVNVNTIKSTPLTSRYNPGTNWMFGNQFLNYVWSNEDPNKWEAFKAFNSGAKQSPALGFTFNADMVKTDAAASSNVRKQYDPALDTGSVDPATVLPDYENKLKAAGMDRIIAEKQRQLDIFLKQRKKQNKGRESSVGIGSGGAGG